MIRTQTILLLTLAAIALRASTSGAKDHWVGTWGCAPQLTEPRNLPPAPLANSTLRQFVHVTIPGKRIRVRFSNAYGVSSVTMNSVHVALASSSGSAGNGSIDTTSDKRLTFGSSSSIVIPAGEAVWSDPLDYILSGLTSLAISINFGNISATSVNGHPGSRTTSFLSASNLVAAPDMEGASRIAHWYIITGVDVLASGSANAVVILGDSLTDGRGSNTDRNDRWPDDLAARLMTNQPTAAVGVLNMGIGGNGIFGGLGPSAQHRFERDVLNQSGVRWLILFEGVNDIGAGATAAVLTSAYTRFIDTAHERGLIACGATITPFGKSGYYSPAHEATRQAVNKWIRTSTKYDAVIDFDAIVRDPNSPTNLLSACDSGDGLHLNPQGYKAMADAVDLRIFAR